MSKRKGMSLEQKRNAMLGFFHRKKEFFQLKELEKLVPKETGMPSQSVQDVLMSLVHDSLVDSEKIGVSTYFWAFPSKVQHLKKMELEKLRNSLEEVNKKLKLTREKIIAARVGREDTEKRQKLLEKIHTMKMDEDRMTIEIQKYKDSDPETLERLKNEIKEIKGAVNRWTDNIFEIQSYCKKVFGIETATFNKQFEIGDLDNID